MTRFRAIAFFFLGCASAFASTNAEWFTRVWNTDDGLLNDQVEAIVQSGDGYLWIVPPVGLMRFDGVEFNRFPLENYANPADDHVSAVLYSHEKVLWIAKYSGALIGLKEDFSTVAVPQHALLKNRPYALAEDQGGALWIAYASMICRLKDGVVAKFGAREGLPSGEFFSLVNDGSGNIWLAKGDQVCVFRDGEFRRVATTHEFQSLAPTPTNAVWYVDGARLFHCDTSGHLQDAGNCPELARARANALLEDHSGAVWIGTDGNGLVRWSESGFEKIETSYPSILSLAEDREGDLWAGTFGGGLDRIAWSAVRLDAWKYGGVLEQVQDICEDGNNRLWGVAFSGLPYHGLLVSRIDGNWTPVFTNAPFAGTVTCVASDSQGAVWIGTDNGELLRLEGRNEPALVQSVRHGAIFALLPTSKGDLWIVGNRTLQILHNGQVQEIQPPRRIQRFSAIAEDAAGNIWVAARNILLRFNGTSCVDETSRLPGEGHRVTCLYGAADGAMWISGGGLGLVRFKDDQVDQIGVEQGLHDDYIAQIVADGRGWFWFAGDHGIFKVRQRELDEAMTNHSILLRPVVYGRNEGLSSLAAIVSIASPFAFPRALCSHDGRVWLLTRTGVVVANPKLLPANVPPPVVLLTRVAMDGQTIASYGDAAPTRTARRLATLNAPLRLPPSYLHLEFDYTAFHFSAPENLHFRYQLAGFDNDWIDAQAERHADYSRLTAGSYRFRVEACSGDGPWSESPAELAFIVTPFFWQTWWFRLGALAMFTAAVIATVRYISFRRLQAKLRLIEQRAALDRERARIARDLHDDLGCSLNKVALTMEMMRRRTGAPEPEKVEQCWHMVREVAGSVDEIVWAINPHNDTLRYLVDYLCQFAFEFLQVASIPCLTELPDSLPNREVSPEARHNLLLAFKEALNNVIRHAGASEVRLSVTLVDDQVAIAIEDNGRGFERQPDNACCDGLRNMRQRMGEIGGEFQLTSQPGVGTRVVLLYPWPAKNGF